MLKFRDSDFTVALGSNLSRTWKVTFNNHCRLSISASIDKYLIASLQANQARHSTQHDSM
ncbi:hypothetical protein M378DRAFT_160416 [Amanita muscaria Koide BX008]|uniref:Uncharacterized protein n=1 Tax=Amanita muscaria (strain Koide BX008) TaxID=946122 RepID=A0A0C2TIT4_AMAMK|nr:hypothetical protein M378DRAFT_160416 [Amanita muscaria Koide BX008]